MVATSLIIAMMLMVNPSSNNDILSGAEYLGEWSVTAYCETGNPCANGNYPTEDLTIACNSLPFGSTVYIEDVGIRVVEDRGPEVMGTNWCDLYLGDYDSCIRWGVQNKDVYLIERGG